MQAFTHIQWASIPQLIVALFLLAQGIVVLIQKPKSSLHQAFFLFQLPIALWLLSMGVAYWQSDMREALFLAKLGFLGVLYIPASTYAFSVYFSGDDKQKIVVYFSIFITALFSLFISNPLFVRGVILYPWGYYIFLGPLSILSILLFIIFVPLFLRNLYKKYKTSPSEQKRWHLLALIMGGLAFVGSIDFLPAFGIELPFPPVGYLFVGSFVTLMGYFMLRHHLADLKIIFGRSVGYSILTLFVFLIYTSFFIVFFPAANAKEVFSNAIIFIILLYIISAIKQKTQKIIDEIFFKEKIDYQALISKFTSELHSLTDTKTLLKIFFSFIEDRLRIQKSYIFLYSEKEKSWIIHENGVDENFQPKQKDVPLSENFKKYFTNASSVIDTRDYIFHPILDDTRKEVLSLIREYNARLVVPILYRSSFLGLIILGAKFSQENFTHKEIKALQNIASPFAIALENARLYENIQYANKMKTDFVSIASHQLRTPLSGLRWSLKILANKELGSLNDEQEKLVNGMYTSSERMIEIVNQLLDVVHIEEDKAPMEYTQFALIDALNEALQEKTQLMREKNVEFLYKIPKNISPIYANKQYTKTIVSIFLDNAIKYTHPQGKILFSAVTREGRIVVSVKDTGIGIPKKEQDNIFNKFFRASNAQSLEPNGSGLGLFYAKTLVEKQGGATWFRSEENRGTTFYFTLPIAKRAE